VSDTSNTFTVSPSTATRVLFSDTAVDFNGRPIDTKVSQPIYSVCIPPGVGGNPCALPPVSTPTKVLAIDAFGNRVSGVNVTITKTAGGGTLSGTTSVSTAGGTPGVAPFGEASFANLSIGTVTDATLRAAASGTIAATTDLSIVNDLEACDEQECDNTASNSANAGIPANKIQKAFGEITTDADFFDQGSSSLTISSVTTTTNVLFSTQFVDGTQTNQAVCGNTGSSKTIGQATDMVISGVGAADAAPDTTMVLLMPKDTIKAYGVTARSATSFNVCLGATRLTPGAGWQAKVMTGKKPSGLFTTSAGAEGRYWGAPADCGTAGLHPDDPCIGLRTKQVATARAYLVTQKHVMTDAEFNQLGMKDADLMVIVEKTSPWDGKGGLY
jgi:hypothetical protein